MEFERRKAATLASLATVESDKSPKGTLDEPIIPLLHTINRNPSYFTTSSCSGRISILYQPNPELSSLKPKKKARGGKWLLVTHEPADADEVLALLFSPQSGRLDISDQPGDLVFRFEPLIIAIECKDLASAQSMVSTAISCGFRESGITSCGEGKRFIIAIRCSIRMEVPLGDTQNLLVSPEYVRFLVGISNEKMEANRKRTDGFFRVLKNSENLDSEIKSTSNHKMATSHVGDKRGDADKDGGGDDDFEQLNLNEKIRAGKDESYSGLEEASLDSRVPYAKLPVVGEPIEKLYLWGHSACTIDDNRKVLVFGGFGGLGRHARRNETLVLDVLHNTLKSVTTKNPPTPRLGHTSALVGNRLFIVGGRADPANILSDVWVLDTSNYEWRFLDCGGVKFPPRHRHAAAVVDSNIYVFGGLNNERIFSSLHVLDTKELLWKEIIPKGDCPCARHSHAMVAYESQLVIFGGYNGDKILGDLYTFDAQTSSWNKVKAAGRGPDARFSHSMFVYKHYIGLVGGCPVRQNFQYLALLDMQQQVWRHVKLDLMCKELFIRCTLSVLGSDLIVVGGGAACYAFGAKFTDPVKINLNQIITRADAHMDSGTDKTYTPCDDEEVSGNEHKGFPDSETVNNSHQNFSLGLKAEQCELSDGKQIVSNWMLQLERKYAKLAKDILKMFGWLDHRRLIYSHNSGLHIRIPVTEKFSALFKEAVVLHSERICLNDIHQSGRVTIDVTANEISFPVALNILLECGATNVIDKFSKAKRAIQSPLQKMKDEVALLIERRELPAALLKELPSRWEKLGDIVVLPVMSFRDPVWKLIGDELWHVIAKSLNTHRLARQGQVAKTCTRDSTLEILVGDSGWVDHRENGVIYSFDATKCMFSWGNISEKGRMGHLNCKDEVVVDLFAGIGYFVLPFLVRAKAKLVYACEWNPHAIAALRRNLEANSVSDHCIVIEGDNRLKAPKGVADRVCLGLLPTSEGSWHIGVQALRSEGGVLHVHGNAKDSEETLWIEYVIRSINDIANSEGHSWEVSVQHVERVKWYAPRVRHVVVDVTCRPRIS